MQVSIHRFTHWRFARGVVDNKAHPVYLVHDGSRDFSQEIEFEGVWLRCHEIRRDHCPQLRYCQHSVGVSRYGNSTHYHNVTFVALVSLNRVSTYVSRMALKGLP